MYCSKCGNELSENINFCPGCGNRIGTNNEIIAKKTRISKNDNGKMITVVTIGVSALIVVFSLFIIAGKMRSKSNVDISDTISKEISAEPIGLGCSTYMELIDKFCSAIENRNVEDYMDCHLPEIRASLEEEYWAYRDWEENQDEYSENHYYPINDLESPFRFLAGQILPDNMEYIREVYELDKMSPDELKEFMEWNGEKGGNYKEALSNEEVNEFESQYGVKIDEGRKVYVKLGHQENYTQGSSIYSSLVIIKVGRINGLWYVLEPLKSWIFLYTG